MAEQWTVRAVRRKWSPARTLLALLLLAMAAGQLSDVDGFAAAARPDRSGRTRPMSDLLLPRTDAGVAAQVVAAGVAPLALRGRR